MKRMIVVAALMLWAVVGNAVAGCPGVGDPAHITDIEAVLNGNLVCGQAGSDKWQEEHRTDGVLWERAKGPSDPVDPSHQVGTWGVTNNNSTDAQVCYYYSGGQSYCFALYDNGGGNYSFCNGGTEAATGNVMSIPAPADNACGFYP